MKVCSWTHADTHHKLREHAVQLIVAGNGECRLHGLQDKVLPQPVRDLRMVIALKAAEDKGHAPASTTTFTRRHDSLRRGGGRGQGWGMKGKGLVFLPQVTQLYRLVSVTKP